MERLFAIAKITRVTGLKGEVRLRPLSRYFESYVDKKPLFMGFSRELTQEVTLESAPRSGPKSRYQFQGIHTRDEAEVLIGQTLFVPVADDDFIIMTSDQVLGYDVVTSDTEDLIGELVDILMLPANDIYVIDSGTREILIPVIPEIVKGLDESEGKIFISPMDGLLD